MIEWEAVIGLEIHIQLKTETKAFSPESNGFDLDPNMLTHQISLAHPGTLPRLNQRQIDYATKLSLALDAQINSPSTFDRKTYFYADMPKAYQITQQNNPISTGGFLDYKLDHEWKKLQIHHLHMEEDAAKSFHDQSDHSLVDFNRAGTPLIELVTEPVLHRPEEVFAAMDAIQRLVRYLGISDGDMEKGQLRCDCNVSIRPIGTNVFNERCEIKNVNSKRFASLAVAAEIKRQKKIIETTGVIKRQTLLYDHEKNITVAMRDKEDAQDYRYFPDPDLPPVYISQEKLNSLSSEIPSLPKHLDARLKDLGIQDDFINKILDTPTEYELWKEYSKASDDQETISEILVNKILPAQEEIEESILTLFPVKRLKEFLDIIASSQVTKSSALQILFAAALANSEISMQQLAADNDILIVHDDQLTNDIVEQVIKESPKQWEEYQNGKHALVGYFVGQIIRKSQGKVDPRSAKEEITKRNQRKN